MNNIRDEILSRRQARVSAEGHTLGVPLPDAREVPVTPFPRAPRVICEVKRRSPSRGEIDAALDPVELVGQYYSQGARSLSVLTEEDYFHGNLRDLIEVKRAYPDCAVLRKDFLVDREDIHVSYLAGADAVLLIASVLSGSQLADLLRETSKLGLAALVELHDEADVQKAREYSPALVGINARNLSTFAVDLLGPVRLHESVDWDHRAVFESGIFTGEDAGLAATSGFDAVLVGEAVVRDPNRIPDIISGLAEPARGSRFVTPHADFWRRLSARLKGRRPLVKICGITNRDDAEYAVELGADVLGFVFAESPRRASEELVRELSGLNVLKVAVVVTGGEHGPLSSEVGGLLAEGILDAVQFHGEESPQECTDQAFPYYRALRPSSPDDLALIRAYGCPRVLIDARSSASYGGTGKRVAPELVRAAAEAGPVWLAGGLSDENIAEIVRNFNPELVDASSGLEAAPGKKDRGRLLRFFKEIDSV